MLRQFTDRQIQAIKPLPKARDYRESCSKGFVLRVRPSGTKSWYAIYYHETKKVNHHIGEYPYMNLSEARERFREIRGIANQGIDPRVEIERLNQEAAQELTLMELATQYIEQYSKRNKKTWEKDRRMLSYDVINSPIAQRKITHIKRKEVIAILDTMSNRGATTHVNRMLALLRHIFGWAVTRGEIEYNPCLGIPKPFPENRRDRYLSESEIRNFWINANTGSISEPMSIFLRLLLATAQRKGELLNAQKSHVNMGEGIWEIPPDSSKNGKPHRVPLSQPALNLFSRGMELSDSEYVFPSSSGLKPLSSASPNQAIGRNFLVWGLDTSFCPHDLRRTAATHMRRLGVPRYDVARVLNHSQYDVTGHYDLYENDSEKRKALELLGMYLNGIKN